MSSRTATPTKRIARLVGLYNADGTLGGEVVCWIGAHLGRRHCSLCDITHGSVGQRPEWKSSLAGLPVRFDTYHRDDLPDTIRGNPWRSHVVDIMNAAQIERFDRFFDEHCAAILTEVAEADPSGAADRTCARAVIGTSALLALALELFVAHR